ncbi:Por secretion system C-terminal sorting domain-containing protein [Catalinimonas alkaloidigena]|uniref:Por secretion system C-terminal sorting domain-containing protein n=1 Tax=Catalinimonas alkaloidigena TaxID=1075417 RepID=A0A1G9JF91_9BACT|nr:family 16 glycosylhydrolase [Catalinimonas alkaloidigena]SDL36230.1 Por secretion system C-terminal sorting domain-containing protein [Catalinimonas alkaloidigena]
MPTFYRFVSRSFRFSLCCGGLCLLLGTVPPLAAQDYQLVWADEFDADTVDQTKWSFQLGDGTDVGLPAGWGNNELEYYRAENATVADGMLTITAKQESFEGYDYTSARLRTLGKGDWTFGRMEMRAKLPVGQGIWPAFWMLPSDSPYGGWAASGEIDIMEYTGDEPNRAFGTLHYGGPWPNNVYSGNDFFLTEGTFPEAFHVFAIEWEYGAIRWYVDDSLYATQTDWYSTAGPYPAPFDVDFHIVLNLAVGGNLPGNPDESTVFPQQYMIDYVRVYQKEQAAPTVMLTSPADSAMLEPGSAVTLTADVVSEGVVRSVQFFQGDGLLGEDAEAPYELTVEGIAAGCYELIATVTDDLGQTGADTLHVTVGAECVQAPYLMRPAPLPGRIEAENFDLGGEGTGYHESDETNLTGVYRTGEGVEVDAVQDGGAGYAVAGIQAGEWLSYTVEVAEAGEYDLQLRVAAADSGAVAIAFGEATPMDTLRFAGTGGNNQWKTVGVNRLMLEAGVQTLWLTMLQSDFRINYVAVTASIPPGTPVVFDDMEHGAPEANGWIAFNGAVGGGGIGPNNADLPPMNGGSYSLQTGWGSGGTPGYVGGFGRNHPVDLSGLTYFHLWINPDSLDGAEREQTYTLEINLQDDDDGDNAIPSPNNGADDEFQYNLTVGPEGSGAEVITGQGWQWVSIPLSEFVDDNSFLTGGNGVLDAISTGNGGNGQLVYVIVTVISTSGADATFRTDYWLFDDQDVTDVSDLARTHASLQAYPNPVTREATLHFALPQRSPVSLHILNALGQVVDVLLDEASVPAGPQQKTWRPVDLPNGVYFGRLQTPQGTYVQKLLLQR